MNISWTDKVSASDFSMDKLSIFSCLHSNLGAPLRISGCCAARKHKVGVGYVFIS